MHACRTVLSLLARLCWTWALVRESWRYLRRALVGGAGAIDVPQRALECAKFLSGALGCE